MSGKKVGITVFIVCLVLALAVVAISNIKITKKDKTANNAQVTEQVSGDKADTSENVSATSVSGVSQDSSTDSQNSQDSETLVLDKIVAEDKLSYSGENQETVGVVSDKFCYLQDSQVVYCIEIDLAMGTAGQKVEYYCTYNTYEGVSVGEKLSVVYKQTTKNTFALMSVSRVDN